MLLRGPLLALGVALAIGAGAPAATGAVAPPRPLSFLAVGAPSGTSGLAQVVDASGRQVLLRGVNVDGLVDYFRNDLRAPYPTDPGAYANGRCPPDDPSVEGVMVCDFDFAQMRPLGFNTIRLNISWSLLEPTPGAIDERYLDRIAQVVDWARAQGIYVVIDMHQDAWSKYVYTAPGQSCPPPLAAVRGYDGAPDWASHHVTPACALNGTRELDAAVAETFQNFYDNAAAPDGVGLQEHFTRLFVVLARRFHDDPTVAGYEIINEPSPGFVPVPGVQDAIQLLPLYAKVVSGVLGAVPGFRQLFFIEPDTLRNITDAREVLSSWSSYSSYPNVVFAPHIYTGVFTLDQSLTGQRFFPTDGGYASAVADARALGLPLWVGEFGNNPADDQTILRNHYVLQDRLGLGGTLWLWKENANDVNGSVYWGVYGKPFGMGQLQPRVKLVSRAYPLLTAGRLQSFSYDPERPAFDMRASAPAVARGDRTQAGLVFLPAALGGAVHADGASLDVLDRGGGSREAYVYPSGGPYHVWASGTAAGGSAGIGLPSTACRSRRAFRVRLPRTAGLRIRSAAVYVGRRRVRSLRHPRRGAVVDLRGLPAGTFTVRVVVHGVSAGHLVTLKRSARYRTCRRGHARSGR